MEKDNKDKETPRDTGVKPEDTREPAQRSSAFNEQSTIDQKSTRNIEEEAGQEQARKDAMTERD